MTDRIRKILTEKGKKYYETYRQYTKTVGAGLPEKAIVQSH